MKRDSSFAALYRQSRYARVQDNSGQVTRQNRQELFAVASVAFLMKHDEVFRRHFLRRICDVAEEDLDADFEIEIQPAAHADLRIRCRSLQAVCIVEFKVGAKLQPKQDPSQVESFLKQPTGYGWTILNAPEYADCVQKTYTVLQNGASFDDGEVEGLRVRSRTWKHLVTTPSSESSLAKDLLDTLGGWGIASLRFRHSIGMTKAEHTRHAADIFQIVTAIAEEVGIRPSKYDFDVQPETGDGSYFGLNIPFGIKRFSKLEKLAGENENALGWFGYSSEEDNVSTLDVWIYCKPSKAAETPQDKVLAYAQTRLGAKFGATITGEEGQVRISTRGDAVADDKEWFESVFEALQDETR